MTVCQYYRLEKIQREYNCKLIVNDEISYDIQFTYPIITILTFIISTSLTYYMFKVTMKFVYTKLTNLLLG